jgi:MoaA/NifB/PqqE/SkfB family radical SAM enzyme
MKTNKYSDFKIFHHAEKLESFIKDEVVSPIYVRIKPINLCNHGCFFCVYSTGQRVTDGGEIDHLDSGMHQDMNESDRIPYEKMVEIIRDLSAIGVKAVTFSGGGEPLMYKGIENILELSHDLGLHYSIITNGQLLTGRKAQALKFAKWVRVSMDYTDPEQMKKFRNVGLKSFEAIFDNLQYFASVKDENCNLGVNFIVHKDNYKNLFNFTKRLKDSGVENVRFSPMYVDNFIEYHSAIKDEIDLQLKEIFKLVDSNFTVNSTYNISPGTSHSKVRSYNKCYVMQTVPVIGADLNVYACHNKAYDNTGVIGSIKDVKFSEMWYSSESKSIFQNFNPKLKCLHECSNDRKNIIMNDFIGASDDFFI